jgi:deoxyribonuclease V
VLFDGHGLAHPRRFGLACHAGLLLGVPAVGCAKKRLVGEHRTAPQGRGEATPLLLEGEPVGAVLRTRPGVKPVYVSAGHLSDTPSALKLVMAATGKFRIPEPLRLAHRATTELRLERDRHLAPPSVRDYPDFVKA